MCTKSTQLVSICSQPDPAAPGLPDKCEPTICHHKNAGHHPIRRHCPPSSHAYSTPSLSTSTGTVAQCPSSLSARLSVAMTSLAGASEMRYAQSPLFCPNGATSAPAKTPLAALEAGA
ncbi:uncharacterized protein CANTADRAFT_337682 [Suhomyces tanzawaensis NRRL Y-17324]|uniref:Uncharacterized protein n=1 Tax=Suhomyces tanzawaensis NRRL Y-17324 TaxID=984487 RepID=A0A1E4SBQ0_9ASCO|nr:uncharacterized protein CANTADRAFT_337682 [Suhomyces tanzawaensis NRRL Y-17324]ODV76929.1 hypothetical protein CANTADRAFT_337682 [Suhomyces tanzawaensis NRRL Y-17324]